MEIESVEKAVEKKRNTYIIKTLKQACAKYGEVINEVSYLTHDPEGTHGVAFLLYLDSQKVLPRDKIEQDIKSATNPKDVDFYINDSGILVTAIMPKIIPSEIYSRFSLRLPFNLTDTYLEILFKCNIIEIEDVDLSLSIFLEDSSYDISGEISGRWKRLLNRLGLTEKDLS
jgi:hypothetical protein